MTPLPLPGGALESLISLQGDGHLLVSPRGWTSLKAKILQPLSLQSPDSWAAPYTGTVLGADPPGRGGPGSPT